MTTLATMKTMAEQAIAAIRADLDWRPEERQHDARRLMDRAAGLVDDPSDESWAPAFGAWYRDVLAAFVCADEYRYAFQASARGDVAGVSRAGQIARRHYGYLVSLGAVAEAGGAS